MGRRRHRDRPFLFGHDRFAVALIGASDGSIEVAAAVDAVVTRNSDGYGCNRVDYELDGIGWEMTPAMNGRMVGLGPIPNPQEEGLIRRKGESRTPVAWMAWGETVPTHGDRRVDRQRAGGHR